MTDLEQRLKSLGLSQYSDALVREGFDTWATVLDITESDLNALSFKLGHRRKLQRAIAEYRGQSHDRPLPTTLSKASSIDGDSGAENRGRQPDSTISTASTAGAKRRYRRHPKADENAPERPPSAYVIFSNQVRESLKGQDLSFTEIAKVVGERWQVLPPDSREICEQQANAAKEKYYTALAEYKKTPEYEAYQKYLEEFRAKHPPKGADGKRSKLEPERTRSTRSGSHDHVDRLSMRRFSTALSEPLSATEGRPESTPPLATRFGSRGYTGTSPSPANPHLPSFHSPRLPDHYSPLSTSPRSATLHKESSFDVSQAVMLRDSVEASQDTGFSLPPPSSSHWSQPHPFPASTSPSFVPYGSHYHSTMDLPSRRPYREPVRLPRLTHEDRTLSSDSGLETAAPPQSYLPVLEGPKALRLLPQPVPSGVPAPAHSITPKPVPSAVPEAHLDRPPPFVSPGQSSQDYHANSSLEVLSRASELASAADKDPLKKERTS